MTNRYLSKFSTFLIGGLVGSLWFANAVFSAEVGTKIAIAKLMTAKQELVGVATFLQTSEGVSVSIQVQGLAPGEHAIHIHETGKCVPPNFMSAGNHFDPNRANSGVNPAHHHGEKHEGKPLGDLPNLMVDDDGIGVLVVTLPKINLGSGTDSLLKQGGTSILIHAGANGKSTIPNVDAKTRIVCGVIAP